MTPLTSAQVAIAFESFEALYGEHNTQIVQGEAGKVGFEDLSGVSTDITWLWQQDTCIVVQTGPGMTIYGSMDQFVAANRDEYDPAPVTTEADERYFAEQEKLKAMTLAELLAYRNQQADARMAAEPGLWCSKYHTDIADWNAGGIFTAEDLLRDEQLEYEKAMRKASY